MPLVGTWEERGAYLHLGIRSKGAADSSTSEAGTRKPWQAEGRERELREYEARTHTTGVWKHPTATGVPPRGARLFF